LSVDPPTHVKIHPTAIVDPGAEIDDGVTIGPYTIIGAGVRIGSGTAIGPHCVIVGHTRIGRDNDIHAYCSLGAPPQDKKYAGEPTALEIGDRNTVREFCTFNRGTPKDAGVTRIGDDNWVMAYCHVAHDCQVGSNVVFANNTQLAGHVHIGDWAILGGFTGVHQFVHVGAHTFTGVSTVLLQDLPPYVLAHGNPAKPYGINSRGLQRRGFSAEAMLEIKRAYKTLYRSGLRLAEARAAIAARVPECPELAPLVDFIDHSTTRGIIR
jgi:UDP-N-acetylglucosamine acyltransferase